ncbi:MAG: hypothetical protein NT045_06885 [Candidatus Aureabacteria bacterium]|nr:hypothetical protein [Candidatus Auribacterota bacterium]
MKPTRVAIGRKGFNWYRTGHAWIYRDDVRDTGGAKSGDVVDLCDERGRFLAKAFYGDRSKIALRILTRANEPVDCSFLRRRIEEAIRRRGGDLIPDGACRLVFSEGDLLPGLIADSYAGWIVLQALIPGMDCRIEGIADIFGELCKPHGIICRNDASARTIEGLPIEKKMLRGERPGLIEVREGEIRYLADLWEGHKTGAYLRRSPCAQRTSPATGSATSPRARETPLMPCASSIARRSGST